MQRLRQRECEVVAEALGELPAPLLRAVEFDLFCGDAYFAGCWVPGAAENPSRYRNFDAYVLWGNWHSQDGRTMVVFPQPVRNIWGGLHTALHEIGHVLHGWLYDRTGKWDVADLDCVSDYACTNYAERFAEAFAAWFYPPRQVDDEPCWYRWSKRNADYFDGLVGQLSTGRDADALEPA